MKAEDKDFGANGSVFYRFATPVKGFSINSLTGEIQATEPLTGLTQAQRTLIVEAMDQGTPAQSAQGVVVIDLCEGGRVQWHSLLKERQRCQPTGKRCQRFDVFFIIKQSVSVHFIFIQLSLSFNIFHSLCSQYSGTAVFQAVAQHPDGSVNGISYSLFSGNRKQVFTIRSIFNR